MMQRALVLAGGGFAASAWEIGLIAGLAEVGIDVRKADLFVGTSSGVRVALHLLSGATQEELFERQIGPRPRPTEPPPTVDWVRVRADLASAKQAGGPSNAILRRIGSLMLNSSWANAPNRRQTIAAQLPAQTWPEQNLLIAVVNAETGERRAFDRSSGIDLVDAVTGSSAFIGWPPALFEGHHYIDGGFYSSDNADLASGFDRVLVLALRRPAFAVSLVALQTAVENLRRDGAEVQVILPDDETQAVFESIGGGGLNPAICEPAARAGRAQGRLTLDRFPSNWW